MLLQSGEEVSDDIRRAADEDEVIFVRLLQCSLVTRHDGGEGSTMESVPFCRLLDLIDAEGTFAGRLYPVEYGIRGHHGQDMIDILVVDHAEDDAARLAGLVGDLLGEVLPSTDIMSRVADHRRVVLQLLPPSLESGSLTDGSEALRDAGGIADDTFII